MAKSNKGIWAYIITRNGTKNYLFQKRWPVQLEPKFGKFDRISLKTSDDAEAEVRAREALSQHEARVKAALGDRPFFDLSKKRKLNELSDDEREALEAMLDQCRGRGWLIWRSNWNPTKNDLLMFYSDTKSGKHDGEFIAVMRQFDFYLNTGTEIFTHYRDALNEIQRQYIAEGVKHLEVEKASAIEVVNLPTFEAQVTKQPI